MTRPGRGVHEHPERRLAGSGSFPARMLSVGAGVQLSRPEFVADALAGYRHQDGRVA